MPEITIVFNLKLEILLPSGSIDKLLSFVAAIYIHALPRLEVDNIA
jgi:hypothetical protein